LSCCRAAREVRLPLLGPREKAVPVRFQWVGLPHGLSVVGNRHPVHGGGGVGSGGRVVCQRHSRVRKLVDR
jgi:hypothetical protein